MQLWVFGVSNVLSWDSSFCSEIFVICWIEFVDPFADLCLPTNQIYSVLLNAFEFNEITEVQNAHPKMLLEDGKTQTRRCKTCKCSEMLLQDVEAGTLKYSPRPPCAPSFVKSRMLRPLQRHFLLFQQIFFILVCIHAWNPRAPPRVLASGPKPCWGNYNDSIKEWRKIAICLTIKLFGREFDMSNNWRKGATN